MDLKNTMLQFPHKVEYKQCSVISCSIMHARFVELMVDLITFSCMFRGANKKKRPNVSTEESDAIMHTSVITEKQQTFCTVLEMIPKSADTPAKHRVLTCSHRGKVVRQHRECYCT